ncbi:MAG TPA: response regulator transcription factor [Clostridiaceae bacterium]|jgi:DNA-binding response OmpR family regulator|nr:response regulator transcription factor [Clostridiaceae bacterium]
MKNILLIEDNESILKGLVYSLEQERFKVTTAMTIKDSKNLLESNNIYNLIILDISLPDGSGFDLCKYIKSNYNIPIIFLTAKDEEQDVVQGFDLGADDYIIKPFRTRELISRANNILRRYNNIQTNIITSSNIKIDLDAQRVYKNDDEIVLTALEYKILALLFTNINQTVSREKILDKIWDIAGNYVNDNTLTVYIKRIRAKLSPNDIIKTIKGIGYRIEN